VKVFFGKIDFINVPPAACAAHEHPFIAPPLCVLRALCGAHLNLTAKHAEGAKTDFKAQMNEDARLLNMWSLFLKKSDSACCSIT
jgi:hypothetical protein